MSDKEQSPKNHQSPVHDASESKPGLDSLAPADGSHQPSPRLSAPGEQPTAPGSLKAPPMRSSLRWKPFVRAVRIFH